MVNMDDVGALYTALRDKRISDIGSEGEFRSRLSRGENRRALYGALASSGYGDLGDFSSFDRRLSACYNGDAPGGKTSDRGDLQATATVEPGEPAVLPGLRNVAAGGAEPGLRSFASGGEPPRVRPVATDAGPGQPAARGRGDVPGGAAADGYVLDRFRPIRLGHGAEAPLDRDSFLPGETPERLRVLGEAWGQTAGRVAATAAEREREESERKLLQRRVLESTVDGAIAELRRRMPGVSVEDAGPAGGGGSLAEVAPGAPEGGVNPDDAAINGKTLRKLEGFKRMQRKAEFAERHPAEFWSLDNWNGARQLFQSAGEELGNSSLYTFGLTDIGDDLTAMTILRKAEERGLESLSKAEEDYVTALAVVNTAGGLYDRTFYQMAGESLPVSALFMIQFAATSGLSGAVTAGAKAALKRILAKTLTGKVGSLLAKGAVTTADVLARSAMMTAVQPTTYADVTGRMVDRVELTDDGARVSQRGDDLAAALGKGYVNSLGNNLSEMSGGIFPAASRLVKSAAWKGLRGASPRSGEFIARLGEKQVAGFLNRATDKLGWHGVTGEFAEEQVNTAFNALFVGDSEFSDLLDVEQQLATGLSVLAMGGAFAGLGSVETGIRKRQICSSVERARGDLAEAGLSEQEINELEYRLSGCSAEGAGEILKVEGERRLAGAEQTPQGRQAADRQLSALLGYAKAMTAYNGLIGGIRSRVRQDVERQAEVFDVIGHRERDAILRAATRSGDAVFVVGGGLSFKPDGSIDYDASDASVFIRRNDRNEIVGVRELERVVELTPRGSYVEDLYRERLRSEVAGMQGDVESRDVDVRVDREPDLPLEGASDRDGGGLSAERGSSWNASTGHSTLSGVTQGFPLIQLNPESGNVSAKSQDEAPFAGKESELKENIQISGTEIDGKSADPAFVRDEAGNIDYERIGDPVLLGQAYVQEFGRDEAILILNDYIALAEGGVKAAGQVADPVDKRRLMRQWNDRLSRYAGALGSLKGEGALGADADAARDSLAEGAAGEGALPADASEKSVSKTTINTPGFAKERGAVLPETDLIVKDGVEKGDRQISGEKNDGKRISGRQSGGVAVQQLDKEASDIAIVTPDRPAEGVAGEGTASLEASLPDGGRPRSVEKQGLAGHRPETVDRLSEVTPEREIRPIGKGEFGSIYDPFGGRVKAASDILMKHREGDLPGVFHRPDIGDIDLVWGGTHIVAKPAETLGDFASVDEMMSVIDDVVRNGDITFSDKETATIDKKGYRAVVAKTAGENWILTSFDGTRSKKSKKVSAATIITPDSSSGRGAREGAVSLETSLSNKDNGLDGGNQILREENDGKGISRVRTGEMNVDVPDGPLIVENTDAGLTVAPGGERIELMEERPAQQAISRTQGTNPTIPKNSIPATNVVKGVEKTNSDGDILPSDGGNGLTAEEQLIVADAKEKGMYLTAPDGHRSRLSPKQWARVRTGAFKDWFGQWPLVNASIKLIKAPLSSFQNWREAADWAKREWAVFERYDKMKNPVYRWKTVVNRQTGNEISFSSNGINKSVSDKARNKSVSDRVHYSAFVKLPEILECSVLGEVHPDLKNSKEDVEIQRYYGAVVVENGLYRVKTTVKKTKIKKGASKNKQYSLEVQKIELMEERPAQQAISRTQGTNPTTPKNSILATKILKDVEKTNSDETILSFLDYLDEHGEPVVLEGSFLNDRGERLPAGETGAESLLPGGAVVANAAPGGERIELMEERPARQEIDNTQGTNPTTSKNSIPAANVVKGAEKTNSDGDILPLDGRPAGGPEGLASGRADEGSARERLAAVAKGLSERLHTRVNGVMSSEINDPDPDLELRKRGSKGWYDVRTGEVTVVLDNAESEADVEATVLHEMVGHRGIRGLLGDDAEVFFERVFDSLRPAVRGLYLSRYGSRRAAGEEYVAELAEGSLLDPGVWQRALAWVREMLGRLGFSLRLTDADIRYLLLQSRYGLELDGLAGASVRESELGRKGASADVVFRDRIVVRYPEREWSTVLAAYREERYLKAPNGKATLLLPRQWSLVRDGAFKEWFGDWEREAQPVPVLRVVTRSEQSLDRVTGELVEKWCADGGPTFVDGRAVYRWKPIVNRQTGRELFFLREGAELCLADRVRENPAAASLYYAAFGSLPKLLEHAVQCGVRPATTELPELQFYYGAIRIGQGLFRVRGTVRKRRDGESPDMNGAELLEITGLDLTALSLPEGGAARVQLSDRQLLSEVIGVSTLVAGDEGAIGVFSCEGRVDVNGEPLVRNDCFVNAKGELLSAKEGALAAFVAENGPTGVQRTIDVGQTDSGRFFEWYGVDSKVETERMKRILGERNIVCAATPAATTNSCYLNVVCRGVVSRIRISDHSKPFLDALPAGLSDCLSVLVDGDYRIFEAQLFSHPEYLPVSKVMGVLDCLPELSKTGRDRKGELDGLLGDYERVHRSRPEVLLSEVQAVLGEDRDGLTEAYARGMIERVRESDEYRRALVRMDPNWWAHERSARPFPVDYETREGLLISYNGKIDPAAWTVENVGSRARILVEQKKRAIQEAGDYLKIRGFSSVKEAKVFKYKKPGSNGPDRVLSNRNGDGQLRAEELSTEFYYLQQRFKKEGVRCQDFWHKPSTEELEALPRQVVPVDLSKVRWKSEVQQTLLEAVAFQKGLERLFGEQSDRYFMEMYEALPRRIREKYSLEVYDTHHLALMVGLFECLGGNDKEFIITSLSPVLRRFFSGQGFAHLLSDDQVLRILNRWLKLDLPADRPADGKRYRSGDGGPGARGADRAAAEAAAGRLSSCLGTPIRVVRRLSDIRDENGAVLRQKRQSKGWYDRDTDVVTVVLPNAADVADVEATVLHEVVGHRGIGLLLGDEADVFFERVFVGLPGVLRDPYLARFGSGRAAAEEYVAELAEGGGRLGLWKRVVSWFRECLGRLGIGLRLSETDIRYLLWRSARRFSADDSAFDRARKVADGVRFRRQWRAGRETPEGNKKNLSRHSQFEGAR